MRQDEKQKFIIFVKPKLSAWNIEPTMEMIAEWWNQLVDYDFNLLEMAFRQASKTMSYGKPTPAHVIQFLPDPLGHYKPNIAWSKAPRNERDGAYVTKEIMCGVAAASESLENGDEYGARSAFIEAYTDAVNYARMTNQKAEYFWSAPSIGTPEEKANLLVDKTIEARRLGIINTQVCIERLQEAGAKHSNNEDYFLTYAKQFPDAQQFLPKPPTKDEAAIAKSNIEMLRKTIADSFKKNTLSPERQIQKAEEQRDRYKNMDINSDKDSFDFLRKKP